MTTVLMDEAVALARVGGDRELLAELLRLFLDEYPQLLCVIERGLMAADYAPAADSAHQLKGLLAQFAAEPARVHAVAVEQALRQADPAAARHSLTLLRDSMMALDPLLRSVRGASLLS